MANTMFKLLLHLLSIVKWRDVHGFVNQCQPFSKMFLTQKSYGIGMFSSLPEEDSIESTEFNEFDRRRVEFILPDELPLDWKEERSQSRYKSGDDLIELRHEVADLRQELRDAKMHLASLNSYQSMDKMIAKQRIEAVEDCISTACSMDPEFCYVLKSKVAAAAERRGDMEAASTAYLEAKEARKRIPQLNMHGLWIGNYGEHGFEMINITYIEDALIATKVTGDDNVPCGEVTFTCDLSPRLIFQSVSSYLEPLQLNKKASRHWGKKYLPRYSGKGQVASTGFQNAQYVDGQLIMVGQCFTFAWMPVGHQVFFERPSPDIVIDMFRKQEDQLKKDPSSYMRRIAETMLDNTFWHEEEVNDFVNGEGIFE